MCFTGFWIAMYCLKKLFDTLDGLSDGKLDVKVVQDIMQSYFNVISFTFVLFLIKS